MPVPNSSNVPSRSGGPHFVDTSLPTCLVSASDKLHNARAILHDLRATTDLAAFWSRFNSTPSQIGWYYGRVELALGARLSGHDGREIVVEIVHALDAIAGLSGCDRFASGLALGRSGNACPELPSNPMTHAAESIATEEKP